MDCTRPSARVKVQTGQFRSKPVGLAALGRGFRLGHPEPKYAHYFEPNYRRSREGGIAGAAGVKQAVQAPHWEFEILKALL
jgi:hypothetical protein